MKQVARAHAGFTLIELMIVVAIIGLLAAIAVSTFTDAQAKAANRAAQSDAKNLLTAIQANAIQ